MREEIGSEFPLIAKQSPVINDVESYLADYHVGYYLSGRIATMAIFEHLKPGKILMPKYVCESILQPFKNANYELCFYDIVNGFEIDTAVLAALTSEIAAIYIIPYYGRYYNYQKIKEKCHQLGILIIEDTTQSIFTSVLQVGDIGLCSLRKWFAIPEGGIVYSKQYQFRRAMVDEKFANLRRLALTHKYDYMLGQENQYYSEIKNCEHLLDAMFNIAGMSIFSRQILKTIDVKWMIERRINNYRYLVANINNPLIKIMTNNQNDECPFMLIIATENQASLMQYLIKHKIWCPILWPLNSQNLFDSKLAVYMANNSLAISIDQRYNINDMERVARILNEYKC